MVVTISMVLAVPVMPLHERLLALLDAREPSQRDYDRIDAPPAPVIIAGYGRFGQIVSRVLRMCDIPFTALEANYAQVDFVRRFGNRIYYGDASRPELLHAAKAGEAKLFVLAIDDVEASVKTARDRAAAIFPISRSSPARATAFTTSACAISACARSTATRFRRASTSAHQALLRLGFGVAAAQRAVTLFREHDEAQLEAQYAVHHDEAQLMQTSQQAAAQLRELFEADVARRPRGFPEPRSGDLKASTDEALEPRTASSS